jgi:hypothetical protein
MEKEREKERGREGKRERKGGKIERESVCFSYGCRFDT